MIISLKFGVCVRNVFITSGRGICQGVELDTVDNRSVTPTAALLGLTLDDTDGAVLEDILE